MKSRRWPEDLFALLPMILVLRLGAVSVAVGAGACAANLALMRSKLPTVYRFALVAAVTAAAVGLWYVLLTYVLR
jgi:hypothetical protein